MTRASYTVLACADGAGGRPPSWTIGIDLLLTDVVSPACAATRWQASRAASRPEIKILYMSGYAEEALIVGRPGARRRTR